MHTGFDDSASPGLNGLDSAAIPEELPPMSDGSKRNPLLAIFTTVFIDLLGFGILLPVFPLLINPGSPYKVMPGSPQHGLILLGGASKHHRWSDQAMLENIATLVRRDPAWSWTVAGSRRTPDSMEQTLLAARIPNLFYVAARDTGPEWLPFRLAEAPPIWVTEDSMSMVYEALSANAAVGVLPVPRRGFSRVSRDMEQLLAEGRLTSYHDWCNGKVLRSPAQPFNEAARCAQWIVEHWLCDG